MARGTLARCAQSLAHRTVLASLASVSGAGPGRPIADAAFARGFRVTAAVPRR